MKNSTEFAEKLTYEKKVAFIKDWDEYQTTLKIPERSRIVLNEFIDSLNLNLPEDLNIVFWFRELYNAICRDLADTLISIVSITLSGFLQPKKIDVTPVECNKNDGLTFDVKIY